MQDSSQYSLARQVNEGHRQGFLKKISHKVKGFCSLLGVLGLGLEAWNGFGVGVGGRGDPALRGLSLIGGRTDLKLP